VTEDVTAGEVDPEVVMLRRRAAAYAVRHGRRRNIATAYTAARSAVYTMNSSGPSTEEQNIQETQLSLKNRATSLEILTFEKYRHLETGVRGH